IGLFGADTDSGTFEYFTEVVNGKAKVSRSDYTASANDNVLVNGVSDSKYTLGYFGYGYYVENKDRLKALSIKKDDNSECVAPTPETIESGTYSPMARPLFIYINKAALKRPEVTKFVQFYLSPKGQEMVAERKFIRMPAATLQEMQARLDEALK
ncbi:MAG: phosphate-binding protein, partial [Planctomycetales bacterium 12-60-4]